MLLGVGIALECERNLYDSVYGREIALICPFISLRQQKGNT
jgi:hypothetical protein